MEGCRQVEEPSQGGAHGAVVGDSIHTSMTACCVSIESGIWTRVVALVSALPGARHRFDPARAERSRTTLGESKYQASLSFHVCGASKQRVPVLCLYIQSTHHPREYLQKLTRQRMSFMLDSMPASRDSTLTEGVPDSPSPVVARSAQTLSCGLRRGSRVVIQCLLYPTVMGCSIVSLWLELRLLV